MVDTVRTLTALQTLFADNINGDITPQDLRDFLISALARSNAGMIAATSTVDQVATTTPTKVLEWDANIPGEGGATPDFTTGKFTIDRPGDWAVRMNVSISGMQPDVFYVFEVRKNQAVSIFLDRIRIENHGDSARVLILGDSDVVQGDEIELFVSHEGTGSHPFRFNSGQFLIDRDGD